MIVHNVENWSENPLREHFSDKSFLCMRLHTMLYLCKKNEFTTKSQLQVVLSLQQQCFEAP